MRGTPTSQILAGTFDPQQSADFVERYRAADLVIAVAQFMADGLEERFGIGGIRTIPNALDLDAFAPRPRPADLARQLAIPDDAVVILYPGSLIARKRPLDILRAASRVLATDRRAIFVFAGDGALRPAAEAFAREHRIEDRIRFLGWTPYVRMPALYDLADLVVLATESEGMARAYLEAMASGLPLVTSSIPSARELVRDGDNGLLFPLGDDPERRTALGRAARLTVADRGIDSAVAAYVREFEALVTPRRSGEGGR
jgi:glycosyltransferase involved in cell wall biosynthesis